MNFIAGIIVINIIIAGITDMTDWPETAKRLLSYFVSQGRFKTSNFDFKLLTCSLCQTFHISNIWLLIYAIVTGEFCVWWLVAPILSAIFVSNTSEILFLIEDAIKSFINYLRKLIVK